MKRIVQLAAAALLMAGCQDLEPPLAPSTAPEAPLLAVSGPAVPGSYIVVLREGANPRAVAAIAGANPEYVYQHALVGFAAHLNQGQLNALQHNSDVRFIEPDAVMQAVATQAGATWGIDRTDQRSLPLSTTYEYSADGTGVHAYIIDTGILAGHGEFTGRIDNGYDAVTSGGSAADCNGHGTHVAGTVGGAVYGMAKQVRLHPVRVLNCQGSGSNSGVIAGVDWVTANAVRPAVANMSLGGGASTALDDAVRRSIGAGVVYAIAAGNGDILGRPQDACAGSPSRVAEAITVGATDKTDKEASFSNYGRCVDLLAPGVNITSAWYTSTTATNTISGTSMATPHVAGAAALYLQTNPGATPAAVASALTTAASPNKITLHSRSLSGGTPNLLLFTNPAGDGGGTPPPPAGITLSVNGSKVQGKQTAALSWGGASSPQVDVFRNGSKVATTANSGSYNDSLGKVSGSYTYKVCESGTTTCSNDAVVTF
jgi:subtilisin family serine protease